MKEIKTKFDNTKGSSLFIFDIFLDGEKPSGAIANYYGAMPPICQTDWMKFARLLGADRGEQMKVVAWRANNPKTPDIDGWVRAAVFYDGKEHYVCMEKAAPTMRLMENTCFMRMKATHEEMLEHVVSHFFENCEV